MQSSPKSTLKLPALSTHALPCVFPFHVFRLPLHDTLAARQSAYVRALLS